MKNKSVIANILYKFVLEIFRILIPVVTLPYVYRIFNPEIMGNIEFSQSIANYFFIFAGFGVYVYGVRELSRVRDNETKRNELFRDLFLISTVSSILVTIIYLFYVYLKFKYDLLLKNFLILNSIQILSYVFYLEWVNEAFENYKFISMKTLIIKIINFICILIFIRYSGDYYKYLFLLNIFIFINNLVSYIYIRQYINLNFRNIHLLKYIFPLGMIVLISNVNILYVQLDKLLLGFYATDIVELAYYGISHKVSAMLMSVIMSVVTVVVPRLSFYLGKFEIDKFVKEINSVFSSVWLILFPISVGLAILSKEILLFFSGDKYLNAQNVMIAFSIRLVIIVVLSILVNIVIFLHKREKIIVVISIICGVINILLKYLLIKKGILTALNAIVTTMIAELILILLAYGYIHKKLKIKIEIFKINYLKYFLCACSFFLIKLIYSPKNNYILYSFIIFCICSSVYLALLLLLKDPKIYELKNILIVKLRRKNE